MEHTLLHTILGLECKMMKVVSINGSYIVKLLLKILQILAI